MKLQNAVMQLRKVCSHPLLFDWPIDPNTRYPVLGEELVNASGKMMVLDRLLRELFKRGHKVLLFSQFTTMLDIIEVRNLYSMTSILLIRCILSRNGLLIVWDGQSIVLMEKRRLWIAVKR
jgi:hypothetical protein